MAKFERNPSGSFPEKTKNKLPDFPLLIYRLLCGKAAYEKGCILFSLLSGLLPWVYQCKLFINTLVNSEEKYIHVIT